MAHGSIRSALKGAAAGMALAAAALTLPPVVAQGYAELGVYKAARTALAHCEFEGFTSVTITTDSEVWECNDDMPSGYDAYETEGDAL